MSNPKNSVTILYGSDTGTAQDYAFFLLKRLRYLLLNPTIVSLDEYPLKNLVTQTKFLIVICATAGQGELPRNGRKFMKFLLKKKLPGDLLNHLYIATFGLGDSSYPRFNYAIKKIHNRLLQLGCQELTVRCEADEQSPEGLDGYYSEWESHLMKSLHIHFPDLKVLNESTVLRPLNAVTIDTTADNVELVPENLKTHSLTRIDNTSDPLKIGTIESNERITSPDHFQDIRRLVIKSENLDYKPGDTLGLFPSNSPENVQALLELQKHWLEVADKPLTIKGTLPHIEGGLVKDLTLRKLLTYHLDIMAIPTRSFFFSLWHFVDTSNEDGQREQEKLKEFCNFDNSEDLYNYADRPRRLILEALLEFENNLTIPIVHIFNLFPCIKPRLFLIASKPSSDTVELVIAMVAYKTIIKRMRKGLCSTWIQTLDKGDQVIFSQHNQGLQFSIKGDNPPLLLVGAGTGIAPIRSIIQASAGTRDLVLFYGFRNEESDYLFQKEWEELENKGQLKLFTCMSRSSTQKKQYAQHKLFEEHELVADLILNKGAIVYICGSSGAMPRQIRETIIEIFTKHGLPENVASQYLHSMENNGTYIQETW